MVGLFFPILLLSRGEWSLRPSFLTSPTRLKYLLQTLFVHLFHYYAGSGKNCFYAISKRLWGALCGFLWGFLRGFLFLSGVPLGVYASVGFVSGFEHVRMYTAGPGQNKIDSIFFCHGVFLSFGGLVVRWLERAPAGAFDNDHIFHASPSFLSSGIASCTVSLSSPVSVILRSSSTNGERV